MYPPACGTCFMIGLSSTLLAWNLMRKPRENTHACISPSCVYHSMYSQMRECNEGTLCMARHVGMCPKYPGTCCIDMLDYTRLVERPGLPVTMINLGIWFMDMVGRN